MHLEQLNYLLSLQVTHSIIQTANQFFISHQAVSKSLKTLEKELAVTLFDRSQRGVTLTPAGWRVCQFAQNVLHEQEVLNNDLVTYRTTPQRSPQGRLTIYAIPRYMTPPFLGFIQNMQSAYPQLNLILHNVTAEKIFNEISFNESTLGLITTCYSIPEELSDILLRRNLLYRILDQQPLYACVHNKSVLAAKEILTAQEAGNYPSVIFTYTSYPPVDSTYCPKFVVDSFEQQKALLKQGNCLGNYTLKEYDLFFSKNYTLIPLKQQPLMLFTAIYPECRDPLVDFFLEHYCKANGLSP